MAQEEFLDDPMPDIIEQWRHYFSLLAPEADDVILDVGCNTGEAERMLVREHPEIGQVIGVEQDRERYALAVQRCQEDGRPGQIQFRAADGQKLPFAAGIFDRAFCVDMLEWVPDPLAALREIRRVLRPRGVALIVHTDFDTQVFRTRNRTLNRRVVHAFTDSGPGGQMGRMLHGLCRQAGFNGVQPWVYTLINTRWAPNLYARRIVEMMVEWLREQEALPESQLQLWLADLAEQEAQGTFFYSVNRNICVCTR